MSGIANEASGMDPKRWQLLAALARERGLDPGQLPIPARPHGSGPAPLSFAQERLWVLDQIEPGLPVYNEPYRARLTGPLDVAALAASLSEVARRHEVLRSRFPNQEGLPVQVVSPPGPLALPLVDLSALPAARREAEADHLSLEEASRPFDLTAGPVLRVTLVRLGETEHLLLLTLHHIVCDAASISILVAELEALYSGKTLPEPPLQYADYAAWQRDCLQGSPLAGLLDYWRERLQGAPPLLDLPTDLPRPERLSFAGGERALRLDSRLSQRLHTLARHEGVTLFMLLLAAFDALLARLSGQDDILVASPVAGRGRTELEGMVGFFINTVVLRTDLSGDPSFEELVRRVRKTALGAFDHQELPFSRLVEELQPVRSPAHAPLVQVAFMLQRALPGPRRGARQVFALRRLDNGTAKFDLTLNLVEDRNDIGGVAEYSASLFHPATVERWLEHWTVLLEAVAERPELRLSELPLLSRAQRWQVLAEWNDQASDAVAERCVHELFEEAAARWPDRVAVEWEGRTLTYGELEARTARVAARLRSLGARPDVAVGLCAERSLELVVGMLGILRAGGCYLPLDPEYPAERLAYMLADSAVRVVVTQERLGDRLPAAMERVVLDGAWEAGETEAVPGTRSLPGNLVYVIYTSGSTGRPKGTLVAHRGVVNMLRWRQSRYPIHPEDRVLQTDSFSFDASVWQFFWPLSAGARLVLTRPGGHRDSAYLVDLMARRTITVAGQVPSMLQVVVQEEGLERCRRLRRVFCGGEALSLELVEQMCRRLPGLELHNVYGPTEASIDATDATFRGKDAGKGIAPIGRPLAHQRVHVLDAGGAPSPPGVAGELFIGGVGLARGYHRQPDLTAERFVPDGVSGRSGERLYRTGDRVRWRTDGSLEFLGRFDHQIKIRGFRIELREIEAALARHPGVVDGVVAAWAGPGAAGQRLAAYFVPAPGRPEPTAAELRGFLRSTLPEHMVPAVFIPLASLPLTPNGKIDRGALPAPTADLLRPAGPQALPRTELERTLAEVWKEVLGVEQVGRDDNFFDLGGHSLLLIQMQARLRSALGRDLPVVELFRFTTIRTLAEYLEGGHQPQPAATAEAATVPEREAVAIVGLTGRFPGARNVEELWQNLRNGVESVTFFSEEELLAAGVAPEVLKHPSYVRACSVIDGYDLFDAAFFGMSPREAQALDPQHRLFLECAWEALEIAGYDPERFPGTIGVFAGMGMNGYLLHEVSRDRALIEALGAFQTMLGNDKDFLPTRVSYKLNLRGPSLLVQTACSTSLVAVHIACRSLLSGECDMALAGGVTIAVPHRHGYMYQDGGIFSPDGHCRAFDASARGTVPASGAGIVVLKRLAEALADGDTIHAVIKSSAINNDGSRKIGYTAPSITGQVDVLRKALSASGADAESISYIETHGTGTLLGDLVELTALKEAYGQLTTKQGFCAIGSLKSNFGHLDTAAGVGGLIKATLALRHRELPPSLHFERPNPRLHLDGSPFFVNSRLSPWEANGTPRRAGVSSFGIGGTNAHVILEEAPVLVYPEEPAGPELVLLSARTQTGLDRAAQNLADHLEQHLDLPLSAVASTLRFGRRPFPHRRMVVGADIATLVRDLRESTPGRVVSTYAEPSAERPVAFLFPGGGAQHAGMTRDLYAREPLFRETVDACAELLLPHLGLDLRTVLYPTEEKEREAAQLLRRTGLGLPALFTAEYALAQLWMSWGIRPQAMIGHSLGEYVVACLSGVFSLADALALVALRGRLFETLPQGAMLGVPLAEDDLRPYLRDGLSIAAVNLPGNCVISGREEQVRELESTLEKQGIDSRLIPIEVAAHSEIVEPILDEFGSFVAELPLNPPAIPFASNLTGTWITAKEATDPRYWRRHLRETVRFADGIRELLKQPERILLEVGPGRTLTTLARRHPHRAPEQLVLNSLRHSEDEEGEIEVLQGAVGQLWLAGCELDWQAFQGGRPVRRVPLPPYPFERQRYWAEGQAAPAGNAGRRTEVRPTAADWLYVPSWERVPLPTATPAREEGCWLFFGGRSPLGFALARRLAGTGIDLVTVRPGADFGWSSPGEISLRPEEPSDYYALLDALDKSGRRPSRVVHGWCLESAGEGRSRSFEDWQALGFESLLFLDQALGDFPLAVDILTCEVHEILGGEPVVPSKATVLGWCREIQRPGLSGREYRSLDVAVPAPGSEEEGRLAANLASDLARSAREAWVAYRAGRRWVRSLKRVQAGDGPAPEVLGEGDVVLVMDGGDGLGVSIAGVLERLGVRVLTAGSREPERWPSLIPEARERFGRLDGFVITSLALLDDASVAAERQRLRALAVRAQAASMLPDGLRFHLSVRSLPAAFDPAGSATDRAAGYLLPGAPWRELVWDGSLLDVDEAEAGEALRRAVALPEEARVVISTRDLPDWLAVWEQAEESAHGTAPEPKSPSPLHSRPQLAVPYVAPRTELEKTLVRIWEEVLGVSPVGVHDHFHALGGDSVLAIQTVVKAQQHGIALTQRKAYLNPTIADLSIAVGVDSSISAKQGVLTGPVSLTPIQRWFFEEILPPDPHHWNLDLLLETREDTDPRLIEGVFEALILHHDALRLRFAQGSSGWQQWYDEPKPAGFFHRIDLSALPEAERQPALAAVAGQLQETLNLADGPLVRVAFFDRGARAPGRLLVIFHHLVIDAVSLRILLEDLEAWYGQLQGSGQILRPQKTTSFDHWALRIVELGRSREAEQEMGYWLSAARKSVSRLPVDFPGGLNTMGSMERVTLSFTPEETRSLLQDAPRAFDADVPVLLLTALARACETWTGERALLVDMEGHGREPIFEEVDLSRTVGWFTSVYPLLLDLRDTPSDPVAELGRVRDQIRDVPNRGIGYGLLRHLNQSLETREKIRAMPPAEVIFLYLSQTHQPPSETPRFRMVSEPRGWSLSPRGTKQHLLDVGARVFGGQLYLNFSYSRNLYRRTTVEGIADAFRTALASLLERAAADAVAGREEASNDAG